ncbi:MAG TPA: tetratricopeptide repeat protein [Thermoanaerobaculia bacterium]|nr:tetratricopeptide repeat protein [Thermoanaerobaculia bacterium]
MRELLPALLQSLPLTPAETAALLGSGLPFESFIEAITANIGTGILRLFAGGEPTATHRWLAKLVRAGLLRTIVTTNFDCLIEAALADEGVTDLDRLYQSEHYEHIDWSEPRIRLIKIHGTVDDEASLAATIAGVAADPAVQKRMPVIEHVFGAAGGDPTIVLGYSCSDAFDIFPAIEAIANPGRVVHVEHASSFVVEDVSRAAARNPFHAYRGERLFCDTAELVRMLWERTVDQSRYDGHTATHPWRSRLDDWRRHIETTAGDGALELLAGTLCAQISDFPAALAHYRRGAEAATGPWRAANLLNAGAMLFDSSLRREARQTFEQAREEFRALANVPGEIDVLRRLAAVAQQDGRAVEACDSLIAALRLAEEHPKHVHPILGSQLLLDLAGMENSNGRHRDAVSHAQLAYEIANELGDLNTAIRALDASASAYGNLGEVADALGAHERAVTLARKLGNRFSEAIHLGKMASCLRMLDRLTEATVVCDEALALARVGGDRGGEHDALVESGNIALRQERHADARAAWTESLQIAEQLRDATRRGVSLGNLAACCEIDRDYDEAVRLHEAALAEFVRVHETKLIDDTQEAIAKLHLRRHDYARACDAFTAALEGYVRRADHKPDKVEELRQAVRHTSLAARAPEQIAGIMAERGAIEEAMQVCAIALEHARESGDLRRQARLAGELGSLEAAHGDPEHAIALGEDAVRLFRETGDIENAARALVNLGGAYERRGDDASAIRCYADALPEMDADRSREGDRVLRRCAVAIRRHRGRRPSKRHAFSGEPGQSATGSRRCHVERRQARCGARVFRPMRERLHADRGCLRNNPRDHQPGRDRLGARRRQRECRVRASA